MSNDTHIFNEIELDQIRLTASGCPRQDGHGVLIARTLLPMDEHVNYEDELCGSEPLKKSKPAISNVVQIYPNPVLDELNIKSDEEVISFKIYNEKGVLMRKGEINSTSISTSALPAGLYSVEYIMPDRSIESVVFVKQR